MRIFQTRVGKRGRAKLNRNGTALNGTMPASDIPPARVSDRTPLVVDTQEETNADATRHAWAFESAWALFGRGARKVHHLLGRAERWHRRAIDADERRSVHQADKAEADEQIETMMADNSEAENERLARPRIAAFALPLIVIFGLCDAAALYYAARYVLDLGEGWIDKLLTGFLSLLGFALIVPSVWIARQLKRAYVAHTDSALVPGGAWAPLVLGSVPLLFLVGGLYAVASLRLLDGGDRAGWVVMLLFTALATFGAISIEFLADVPARHALDRLEAMARRASRRLFWYRHLVIIACNRRDRSVRRARGIFHDLRAKMMLALVAAVGGNNGFRSEQPAVWGTVPVEYSVGQPHQDVIDSIEELANEIENTAARFARIGAEDADDAYDDQELDLRERQTAA